MNPPRTVGGTRPQVNGQGRFNHFNPIRGIFYFLYRNVFWNGVTISENENPGGNSFKKSLALV